MTDTAAALISAGEWGTIDEAGVDVVSVADGPTSANNADIGAILAGLTAGC